jgi:uncharacterized membrane protein HdeD (DUF308 family)
MSYERIKEEELTRAEKGMVKMRSITNYVMGIVLIACGFMIFFPPIVVQKFIEKYDATAITLLGILCFIYGIFRIYRGYKKNYFRAS